MTFHASEIGVKPVRIETSLEALAPTCGERLAHDERPAVVGEDYGGTLMVFGNDSPRPLGDECHSRFTTPDYDKPATLFSWSVLATHHMPLMTKRPATMPAVLGARQCALFSAHWDARRRLEESMKKHDKHDQPDFVDIGGDRDDSWVADGIFDMWVKTPSNKWGYRPDKPSKRK